METLVVAEHIYGLPGVAFGGYVAGVLANRTPSSPVRVDFRAPVPLGRALTVVETQGGLALSDGDRHLAEVTAATLDAALPEPPSWETARAAVGEYLIDAPITHRDCFGCGPDRPDGLGIRVFPGLVPRADLVACAWRPSRALSGPGSSLAPELVWAALDCPAGWARRRVAGAPPGGVTANMAAAIFGSVTPGEPYVVISWPISRDGRKTILGSATFARSGEAVAAAQALWIDVPQQDHEGVAE